MKPLIYRCLQMVVPTPILRGNMIYHMGERAAGAAMHAVRRERSRRSHCSPSRHNAAAEQVQDRDQFRMRPVVGFRVHPRNGRA
jgi:hypothetical protein